MAILKDLTTEKAPFQTLATQDLEAVLIDNNDALSLLVYGDKEPRSLVGHNHAGKRGRLLNTLYQTHGEGPYLRPSALGAPLEGIPAYPPVAGVSFESTPKLLLSRRISIPGGVQALTVSVLCLGTGVVTDFDLRAEIRPLGSAGFQSGTFPFNDFSVSIGAVNLLQTASTPLGIRDLGSVWDDRDLEFCLWLISDPQAGTKAQLLSTTLAFLQEETPTEGGTEAPNAGPFISAEPAQINQGQVIDQRLTDLYRRVQLQEAFSIVGAVPGVYNTDPSLSTALDAEPYVVELMQPHQHTGTRAKDKVGDLYPDGVPIFEEYGSRTFYDNLGDDAFFTMTAAHYRGVQLHPTGVPLSLTEFFLRSSIPSGVFRFSFQAALDFANASPQTRLWVCAALRKRDEIATANNLLISAQQGQTVGSLVLDKFDALKRSGFVAVPVDPIDSPLYLPTIQRSQAGLGSWTDDALRIGFTYIGDGELSTVNGKYRTTKEVFLTTQQLATGDYQFVFRFILQLGSFDSTLLDTGARLLWLSLRPVL